MATYRVIKAHDGLKVGDIRVLDPCPVADYMVDNGYWEVIGKSKDDGEQAVATKENTKKSKKK